MSDYDVVLYDEVGTYGKPGEASGGSEHAFLKLGALLKKRGYRVLLQGNVGPRGHLEATCKALICMRYGRINPHFRAERTFVWAHDASADAHKHLSPVLMSGEATMICVSGWHAEQMPRSWKKIVIPPMIEPEIYESAKRAKWARPLDFLYASGVVKGLKETLAFWGPLAVQDPRLHLYVTTPYGDLDPDLIKNTPSTTWLGRISPSAVAENLAQCAGLFYVNVYPETFCTLAAVAEAAGARCHILTTGDPGGLPEATRSPLLTTNPMKFVQDFHEAIKNPEKYRTDPRDLRPETILPRWEKLLGLTEAEPTPAKRRATVCLSMIAKNAGPTIERALTSTKPFIDSYAILLDDGLADDPTEETIRKVMGDLPGKVLRSPPCGDMAKLRNKALTHCGDTDYALILDADDWLEAEPWFEFDPCRDAHQLLIEEGIVYPRTQLVRLDKGFRYDLPAHEVMIEPPGTSTAVLHGLRYRRDRATSTPAKYEADARALKKVAHRDPRAAYYYAQSLYVLGKLPGAIRAFKHRIEMTEGYYEERFISMMHLGRIYRDRGNLPFAERWFRRAAMEFSGRAVEPLTELARMHRDVKQWGLAYAFASWGMAVNRGVEGALFLDIDAYRWRLVEELALAAFYLGDRTLAQRMYEQLLASPNLPAAVRPRVQEGLAYSKGEDPNLVKTPDGSEFFLPAIPEATRKACAILARNVFAGEYEAPGLPKDLGPGRIILDIGAHIGSFATWARLRWPGVKITCYEPNGAAADLCEKNNPKAKVYRKAVTTDPSPFLVLQEDWGCNYIQSAWGSKDPNVNRIRVPAANPKGLPRCDVLKVDAEGSESAILENYRYLDEVEVCLYEYHTEAHRDRCRALCEKAGLHLTKHVPESASQGIAIWVH